MPFLPRLKTELLETTREVFIVVIVVPGGGTPI